MATGYELRVARYALGVSGYGLQFPATALTQKFEIRSTKFETNSNDPNSEFKTMAVPVKHYKK
jgi:hypothetical protein